MCVTTKTRLKQKKKPEIYYKHFNIFKICFTLNILYLKKDSEIFG